MRAKLPGYIPCNPRNASHLLFLALAALPLVCSPAGLCVPELLCSRRLQEAGGLKPLASFISQRERSFSLAPASQSGMPWWAPHKAGALELVPGVRLCFFTGHMPSHGQVKWQPKSPALYSHWKLVPCLDLRSLWFDPVLPKARLSSLLVSMKNAPIIAPDGTQTNLGCQLWPTGFQGLCLTSMLFPSVPIEFYEVILLRWFWWEIIFSFTQHHGHYIFLALLIHSTSFYWVPAVCMRHFSVYQGGIHFCLINICWESTSYVTSTFQDNEHVISLRWYSGL